MEMELAIDDHDFKVFQSIISGFESYDELPPLDSGSMPKLIPLFWTAFTCVLLLASHFTHFSPILPNYAR